MRRVISVSRQKEKRYTGMFITGKIGRRVNTAGYSRRNQEPYNVSVFQCKFIFEHQRMGA